MSTDAFIDQLYNNILAREADAEGKAYWLDAIDSRSLSAVQATQVFLSSGEFATTITPLASLYYTTFNRAPDAAGLAFWAAALQAGSTFIAISESFMASAEYQALYGGLVDNSDFIDQVYSNSFARAADAEGHANWLAELDQGMSRAELLGHFARSPELAALRGEELKVIAQYHSVLGADPRPAEFANAAAATSPLQLTEQLYAHVFYRGEAVPYFVDTLAPRVSASVPLLYALPTDTERSYASSPLITPVGTGAHYVVNWWESRTDQGLAREGRLQQVDENGQPIAASLLHLETQAPIPGFDVAAQVTALGSSGDYLLTWYRDDVSFIFGTPLEHEIVNRHEVFIQHVNADGSTDNHPLIQIDGTTEQALGAPVATTLGSTGDYLVAWAGYDVTGVEQEPRIFLKSFGAEGNALQPNPVELALADYAHDLQIAGLGDGGRLALIWRVDDGDGQYRVLTQVINADGSSVGPATELGERTSLVTITALGNGDTYAVAWSSYSSEGDASVFAQVFNADGSAAANPIEINVQAGLFGSGLQIAALGSSGEFVLAWNGVSTASSKYRVFTQKFNADGGIDGNTLLQLNAVMEPFGNTFESPSVSAIGSEGAYVVAWSGLVTTAVQRVGADGKLDGEAVYLQAGGPVDVSAVGNSGEYVLAWSTASENTYSLIFIQAFNADGTRKLDADGVIGASGIVTVTSNERGQAYLVNSEVVVTSVLDITSSADELWNVSPDAIWHDISNSHLYATGLVDGDYYVYSADEVGNLSQPAEQIIIIGQAQDASA